MHELSALLDNILKDKFFLCLEAEAAVFQKTTLEYGSFE